MERFGQIFKKRKDFKGISKMPFNSDSKENNKTTTSNNTKDNINDFIINESNLLMKDIDHQGDDINSPQLPKSIKSGDYDLLNDSSITLKEKKNEKTPVLVLVYLYFIVIASVLGTGILALPVKLSQSGFNPFIASYTLCYLMQLVSVFYLIEILQRVYSIIKSNSLITNSTINLATSSSSFLNNDHIKINEEILLEPLSDTSLIGEDDHLQSNSSSIKSSPKLSDSFDNVDENGDTEEQELKQQNNNNEHEDLEPNLHYVGLKFLGNISYPIFIFSVLLHFCSTLISYGLAGSEAYAQIFGISHHSYVILPVVLILSLVVIFGSKLLQHIITFFTFGKGTLLVIIVFITGIISNQVENPISNDWEYIGKSFLISTVALGGSASVLPLVFPKIIFNRREMMKCYAVVASALSTVYFLNITWCWFLLRIIPQLPNPLLPESPSLLNAAEQGQIATIPLMNVVKLYYPNFLWIARIIDIFIVISITISFITVGNGFKHILDGFIHSWRSKSLNSFHHDELNELSISNTGNDGGGNKNYLKKLKELVFKLSVYYKHGVNRMNHYIDSKEAGGENISIRIPIREIIFYGGFFGFILMVCLLNPKGFLLVMEGGSSLGLNLQAGLFIVLMLNFSRSKYENYRIPLPVNDLLFHIRYLILVYFSFAVLYDFYLVFK